MDFNTNFAISVDENADIYKGRKEIPVDVDLYGEITKITCRNFVKPEGKKNGGRGAQVWNVTFEVKAGEYAGQTLRDTIWMDIEWTDDMGQPKAQFYGNIAKGSRLMNAVGYPLNTIEEGKHAGTLYCPALPPSEAHMEQAANGSGMYPIPLVGTILGVRTGESSRPKRQKDDDGNWLDVLDADGKRVYEPCVGIKWYFEAPDEIADEINNAKRAEQARMEQLRSAEQALTGGSSEDIPF
jgi:hypothetical protein